MGTRGSSRTESDLAVGHDKNLGGAGGGMGLLGERDRLLHTRDRRDGISSRVSLLARFSAQSQQAGRSDGTVVPRPLRRPPLPSEWTTKMESQS